MPAAEPSTLEWFGATTFRLKTHGLTAMLDTWVERPSNLESYAKLEDITECDWLFISHGTSASVSPRSSPQRTSIICRAPT